MRIFFAAVISSLAALAIQPLVLFGWFFLPALLQGEALPWNQIGLASFMSVVFAVPFVLLLGLPLTATLQRVGYLNWWRLAIVGAIAGGLFAGWNGPGGNEGFSSGGGWYGKYVDFVVNGEPTFYGWLNYLRSVAGFALHGFAGGTLFYMVWSRLMAPNNSSKPTPLRGAG